MISGDDKVALDRLEELYAACYERASKSLKGKGADKMQIADLAQTFFVDFQENKRALEAANNTTETLNKVKNSVEGMFGGASGGPIL